MVDHIPQLIRNRAQDAGALTSGVGAVCVDVGSTCTSVRNRKAMFEPGATACGSFDGPLSIHSSQSSAYRTIRRLFAVQGTLGFEHGIRGLAANPVHILVKPIDDTRSRQTVEPFAQ